MTDLKSSSRSLALAGASLLALFAPGAAFAQATPPAPSAPPASAAAPSQADAEVEELVITGSRIRNSSYTSSSPVTVITAEQSALEGTVDTSQLLQGTSAASGSLQLNNTLSGYVVEGGGGIDSVSLRGLGANRTLVLLNGRRAGPAGTRGQVQAVDLNTIPSSMIDRVEVLKDGASSIYGSDAVAGVINIITKKDLDGFELAADLNATQEGGGGTQRYSLSYGKTFDRGYFTAAADYYHRSQLQLADRKETACTEDYLFKPAGGRVDYISALNPSSYKCFNLSNNYLAVVNAAGTSLGNFQARVPNILYPNAAAGATQSFVLDPTLVRAGRNGYPDTFPYFNTESALYDRAHTISPVDRMTLSFTGGFDLTSNVEAYTEIYYNRRTSEQFGARQLFPNIRSGNPNARQPNGTAFGTAATDRIQPVIALPSDASQEIDYYRVVGGLRGVVPDVPVLGGWDWDIYAQYSKSKGTYTDDIIYRDRMNALGDTRDFSAASAATQAGFLTSCFQNAPTGNLFFPGNVSGYSCSQLPGGINWTSSRILAGQFNDAERAFLFAKETGETEYTHKYVEGSISGDLFELPAGMVGAALGFQYRKEELDDTPGAQSALGNRWGQTAASRTAGSDTVAELFGEAEIPLLKGLPLIDSLTASVSGRSSDYESYGRSDTYKVGLNWQIIPALRIRGTKGTSFRAPALYEQFLGNQTGFAAQSSVDACINYEDSSNANLRKNCASLGIPLEFAGSGSSATVITGGGRGVLVAETAESTSVGVIFTPSFADISVAIDYFDIHVDDEVRRFGSLNIVNQCYISDNFPNDPFCKLFNRDPATFQITTINNSYVNVASQSNRGIDVNTRYSREFDFGKLTFEGEFTWQLVDDTTLLGGSEPEDYLGTTYWLRGPDFTGNTDIKFEKGDFLFTWATDFYGKGSDTEYYEGDVFAAARYANLPAGISSSDCAAANNYCVYYKQYTEFTAIHSASIRYKKDDWRFTVGMRNIFDEVGPAQSSGQGRVGVQALGYPTYDVYLGRQVFAGLMKRF